MIDTDEYERRLREAQPFNHLAWELIQEVKRLREENKLMVDDFRFIRDGFFTDADWRRVNEWIGDEEE